MSGRKRGIYFNYLGCNESSSSAKIPRQTRWNRQKKIKHSAMEELINSNYFEVANNSNRTENETQLFDAPNNFNSSIENCDSFLENPRDSGTENDEYLDEQFQNIEEPEDTNYFAESNVDSEDMRTLHPNTTCTVNDVHCMIYAYVIRHGLTWTATEDLIRLINRVIGREELLPSKYNLKKKIKQFASCDTVKHFVCHQCDLYLGSNEYVKSSNIQFCTNCHTKIQLDTKYKKNHFITIPFKTHLKTILEQNSDSLNFNVDSHMNEICDVHDAIHFKNIKREMNNVPFITLTFSVDGGQVFESTKDNSLWPLQFIINELKLEQRFKRENMFCAAISFGKTPSMQVFFKPFIEEIKHINAEGGLSFNLKNGQIKRVKIFPMIFTGDTPAKCHVLNKVQFNGYQGCPYCTHNGSLVNRQIRYCKRDSGDLRTNEKVREDMLNAHTSNERVNGYHGVSPLISLENFDVVWQVAIDKMHNIDLGVTRLLFKLFLDNRNRNESYYIGRHLEEIDKRILEIRLPKSIRRNLKPLSDREHYHSHEWKYLLLFVAYPILKNILPERYLNHLAQLIDATHILCGTNISSDSLQEADKLLSSFVDQFEILYGEERMVFNVHLLKHLANCVRHIGPLHTYSNYNFEDNLGHLIAFHKGTTDVATQVCEKYLLEKNMFYHLARSSLAQKFYNDINSRRNYTHCRKIAGSLLIGKPKNTLSEEEIILIADTLNLSYDFKYEEFNAILLNNTFFYESFDNSAIKRTNDSFIFNSRCKQFGIIESILVIDENLYVLANEKFEILFDGICKFNIPLKELDIGRKKILKVEFIGPKFAFIKYGNNITCSKFPNMFERD